MSDIHAYVWVGIVLTGMVAGYLISWWSTKDAKRWAKDHPEWFGEQ